jgi:hypothetical protein
MANQIQGEGSIVFGVRTKLELLIGAFGALKFFKNIIKLKKSWPPKVEGVKNSKNKPPNATKVNSQTPKKILVCCY